MTQGIYFSAIDNITFNAIFKDTHTYKHHHRVYDVILNIDNKKYNECKFCNGHLYQ
jgi:hypothetical protein